MRNFKLQKKIEGTNEFIGRVIIIMGSKIALHNNNGNKGAGTDERCNQFVS